MFYFQQLLGQGLAGIDRMSILSAVIGIAYTILVIGFLVGLYQAAMRGGDMQALGVAAIKYVVVAIILANWSPVFREVNDSFNHVAQYIGSSSSAGDMFLSWMDQLQQQFQTNGGQSLWPLITGQFAAAISVLLVFVAYLLYAVAVVVFGMFYTLYGCILYVLGPLVLALLPIAGIGQLARNFAVNLMIWNAWGILYAIFGALITAVNANRISDLSSGFMGFFTGNLNSLVLGLISIFYALGLMLIPLIAKRLISSDVGSATFALVRAGAVAAGTAVSAAAGFAAGAGVGSAPGAAVGAGASSSVTSSSTTAVMSSSMPPPQPTLADTIRSGIMSAVNGGAPPAPRTDSASGGTQPAAAAASSSPYGGSTHHGFRPHGMTQTVAFHAGRFAGSAVRGATNGDTPESGA